MRTAEQWLSAYGATHRNPLNQKIHTVCVPSILFSILGACWHVQLPDGPWWLNGCSVVTVLALAFYGRLGKRSFVLMAITMGVMNAIILALEWSSGLPTLSLYASIFIVAWIGQFIGHYFEGKSPSFFEDLQFLLIGPLWVFYH